MEIRKMVALSVVAGGLLTSLAAEKIGDFATPPRGWKGLRVGVLGDSITDKHQIRGNNVYWQYLTKWLEWDSRVYGISGHQWSHIPGQTDRMIKEMGDAVDAVFIFVGTNDFAGGVPLGEWYDYVEGQVNWWGKMRTLKERRLCFDSKTVKGRINVALKKLKTRYPDSQIVILTPTTRAFFQCSPTNVQPAMNWPNTLGLYLDDYVKAVKEGAAIWGCPVIDLNAEAGLVPLEKEAYGKCFRNADHDLLHPNSEGHRRLADVIYCRLSAIPASFRRPAAKPAAPAPAPAAKPMAPAAR